MRLQKSIATALAVLTVTTSTGCLFPPIPTPAIPLSRQEQTAVVSCQRAMSKQVDQFFSRSYKQLERCAADALALRLEEERELDSTNIGEYVRRRQQIADRCNAGFARIGSLSTRLIETVAASCASVEDLILELASRGDPLGWKTLNGLIEALSDHEGAESVEEIGGLLCFSAMDHLEELFGGVVPRTDDLTEKIFGMDAGSDFLDHLHSFLDSRCASLLDS